MWYLRRHSQWLGYDEPDPNNDHYNATVEACSLLCAKLEIQPDDLLIWLECAHRLP